MSSFNQRGELVIADGRIIVCQGKKKSGKSVMGLLIFRSFAGDRVVIDVAGDDGPTGPGVVDIRGHVGELPTVWPEHLREDKRPMTLRYAPDAGSATFAEDIDAVVGLAYEHSRKDRQVCLLIHELGVVAQAGRTQPHMRRVLMHNRHHGLTMIGCCPRAMNVEPLVLHQADLVYTFEMPSKADRERTAETIGWDLKEFSSAVHDMPMHGYLRFDANEQKPAGESEQDWRLVEFDPLPEEVVRDVLAWAHGGVPR